MRALLLLLLLAVPSECKAVMGRWGQVHAEPKPGVANCTWEYFDQKLDHFGNGPASNLSYKERYCLYTGYWKKGKETGFDSGDEMAPIFFYTGNESPVEEYVNNTGLMWELGEKVGALIVFAEHRYEGDSVPVLHGVTDCISYCTTSQALADYAALIKYLKNKFATNAPVIAFGGSYGGMLAGWMRIKYPDVLAGAIAASAPVSGFPVIGGRAGLDSSAQATSRGLSSFGGATDMCAQNLRATWPLLTQVFQSPYGKSVINKAARRCSPGALSSSEILMWGQTPWFYMAEGDYPFPSTYITYSVGPGLVPLPAWPLRVACSKGLNKDHGIVLMGSTADLNYTLKMGAIEAKVDWASLEGNGAQLTKEEIDDSGIFDLVRAMTDAAGVWFNISGDKECYGGFGSEGEPTGATGLESVKDPEPVDTCNSCPACDSCTAPCPLCNREAPKQCSWKNPGKVSNTFAWGPVCCNEDLYLSNTDLQGVGHDVFWPPSGGVKRGYTLEDVIGPHQLSAGCRQYDAQGLFGTPKYRDAWSSWMTEYYDSANVAKYTNIMWSNGALDPWSGAGVYPKGGSALGPVIQNLTSDGSSAALVIDLGGHHLDLFFATPEDPPSVLTVRAHEAHKIRDWSQEHYDSLK